MSATDPMLSTEAWQRPSMSSCNRDDGSYTAGHAWHYGSLPLSGEPVRRCSSCDRAEVYYLDDLEFEQEMLNG